MSNSHLNIIQNLLNKKSEKSLSQGQVKNIESHFRDMSNIHDEHDNRQDTVNKRQKAFDEFQQKVESEGTCVITLTPEELLPKGIVYKKSFEKQATEAVQAMYAWGQATAEFSLNFYGILSDTWLDDYANTTEQAQEEEKEAQAIKPHAPTNLYDAMEQGESHYQEPEHQEEVVTSASEQAQAIDETRAVASNVSNSTENSTTINTRMHQELKLFFAESTKLKPVTRTAALAFNHEMLDDLMFTMNQASAVLRAYLVDEDIKAFNQLYDGMMLEFDFVSLSLKSTSTGMYYTLQQKQDFLQRLEALEAQLEPKKLNFESKQGGGIGEQVSAWFAVKFWLFSTLKVILNAVGLRSSASFFSPAPSKAEQESINDHLQQLKNIVQKFENMLTDLDPDANPDSGINL